TALIGQVDAVAQRSVQQHLTGARQKAIAIDSNLVASCHCLIPEGFKFPTTAGAVDPPSLLPGMRSKTIALDSPRSAVETPISWSYQDNRAKRVRQSGERVLRAPRDVLQKRCMHGNEAKNGSGGVRRFARGRCPCRRRARL